MSTEHYKLDDVLYDLDDCQRIGIYWLFVLIRRAVTPDDWVFTKWHSKSDELNCHCKKEEWFQRWTCSIKGL